jgi:adenine-specific DNA-methyltransferase
MMGNQEKNKKQVQIIDKNQLLSFRSLPETFLWNGNVEEFLDTLPEKLIFDLVFTSPPYNIGKAYEQKKDIKDYLLWQKRIIEKISIRLKKNGSICWQVGNFLEKRKGGQSSTILSLDIVFHEIFSSLGLQLRNRVVWHFGHGLHCKYRFSGRYEVVLWYTKTDEYIFNLENVLVEQKYPGKKYFKGPNLGKYSCNPKGKNPDDVWDIPNVKSNHIEKTNHPCQFPVALVDRFVLALTNPGDLVFDPFAGVGSAGVAALFHGRHFWGCEIDKKYIEVARTRLEDAANGHAIFRPFNKPIYDHKKSKLSRKPVQ